MRQEDDLQWDVTDHGVECNDPNHQTAALRRLLSMVQSVQQQQERREPARHFTVTIVIPEQCTITSYPLNLTSYVTLQVDGTLRAVTNLYDDDERNNSNGGRNTNKKNQQRSRWLSWPILPPLPSYGTSEDLGRREQYQSFLYAGNATRVRITGSGVIDGSGEVWWDRFRGGNLRAGRPNLIQLVHCTRVTIDSVTLRDAPFWTLHPVYCSRVHVHNTKIRARMYAPNVDGIDPDSCRHVLIERNDVAVGDDHVAIKSGRCHDGWTSHNCSHPVWTQDGGPYQTYNVTVRYNIFRTGMGIAVGSETSGGIRNVHIHDNVIGLCDFGHDDNYTSCGWGPALHIKTTPSRGGRIHDVTFADNVVYNTSMFLLLEMNYQQTNSSLPEDYPPTRVSDVSFVRNRALGRARGADFACHERDPCRRIVLVNNTILSNSTTDNEPTPWHCHFVQSYRIQGNVPPGLQQCMANAMNNTSTLFATMTSSLLENE